MKKSFLVFFLFGVLGVPVFAQSTWIRTFGGSIDDWASSVALTNDGGYMIVGGTDGLRRPWWGDGGLWLIKLNSSGDSTWSKLISKKSGDAIQPTRDGGFVIAGSRDYSQCWFCKITSAGDTVWSRTFDIGMGYFEGGRSIQQTREGGYILTGNAYSLDSTNNNFFIYLIKTNSSGDSLWARTFGDSGYCGASSLDTTADGGYVIIGGVYNDSIHRYDVYLIKTDSSGQVQWSRTYDRAGGDDTGYDVVQTIDGNYIIVGITHSSAGLDDVYLIKTNSVGDTIWTRTFGGAYRDYGYSVRPTIDGGYIIAGKTESFGAGIFDVYLIKTDQSGNALWTRTFGSTHGDGGNSVRPTPDGGYIIAGYTGDYSPTRCDVYIIKTDSVGNVGVKEYDKSKSAGYARSVDLRVLPNPAKGRVSISFGVAKSGPVALRIYDALGRCTLTLMNENRMDGSYSILWDGRDESGQPVPEGIYFCRLSEEGWTTTQRLVFLR